MSLPLCELGHITSDGRIFNKGAGQIAGITSVNGSPASCRVTLFTSLHVLTGFRRTGSNGAYSFPGVAAGQYYLIIADDNQSTHRSKVEHVEVI